MATKTPFEKAFSKLRAGLSAVDTERVGHVVLHHTDAKAIVDYIAQEKASKRSQQKKVEEIIWKLDDVIRPIEQSLAYEHAASLISSTCVTQETSDLRQYYDLSSAEIDLAEEAMYLDSRGLLLHHSANPAWVMILDEGEPSLEAGKVAA